MKFGTLVQHAPGYKMLSQIFNVLPRDLVMVFQNQQNGVKSSLNFERSYLSPQAKIKNSEANVL